MDLIELGSRLKEERQRKGLSVEEVMDLTKISRRNILAIEAGDEGELPHPVYAKGFVKIYSKVLGFDPEEFAEAFSESCPIESEYQDERPYERLKAEYNEEEIVSSIRKKKSSLPAFLLVLVVVAVAGGVVYYLNQSALLDFIKEEKEVASARKTPEAEVPAAVKKSQEPDSAQVDSYENSNSERVVPSGEPQEDISKVESEAVAEPVEQASEPEVVETEASAPSELASSEKAALSSVENNVVITAKKDEACWMEIVVDENSSREMILRDGDSITIPYKDNLRIKLGNSGGVTIRKNGNNYPFKADMGKVKTIVFS